MNSGNWRRLSRGTEPHQEIGKGTSSLVLLESLLAVLGTPVPRLSLRQGFQFYFWQKLKFHPSLDR